MSFKSKTHYLVICDKCNVRLISFAIREFGTKKFANENALQQGWYVNGDNHQCKECFLLSGIR